MFERYTLDLSPLLPWPVLAVLGILALVALAALIVSGKRGALLRLLATLLLFGALLDPSFVREEREKLPDTVAIVVDRSGSQSIADRTAMTDQALETVRRQLADRPQTDIRVTEVFERDGQGDGTRLFEGLAAALADVPPERLAGVIAITDGQVHDVPANRAAIGLSAPFHALITGHADEFDRRIEVIEAPRFGIVGREVTASVRVVAEGRGGGSTDLVVRQNGQEILRRQVAIGARIQVPLKIDRAGMSLFEISIPALPGELTALNNTIALPVDGVREKLRVLLVSGEPHAGERTWRNLLKADPNVELVHFTILRPPDKQDGTPTNELSLIAFPTRELFVQKIKEFDLIIFDRYSNQTFLPALYFENMVSYVREGGAMLFAVGPEITVRNGLLSTSLREIMPAAPTGEVIERPFRARLAPLGERHPVTRGLEGAPPALLPGAGRDPAREGAARDATWAPWFRQIAATNRDGQWLLSGAAEQPLLVLKREQKGRVGIFLSDHVWLWARGYEGGGPYLDLLRRLSHWLMKEPELEEEALRLFVRGRMLQVERRTIGTAPGDATITLPNGDTLPVTLTEAEPGIFRAELALRGGGLYRVENGGMVAFANAGPPNPREYMEVVSTTSLLQPLANETGGAVRRLAAGEQVNVPRIVDIRSGTRFAGADFIGLKPAEASVLRGVTVVPLGIGFAGLLLLLVPLILAWLREGTRVKS